MDMTKPSAKISEIADLRGLARGVIAQAVRDLGDRREPVKAVSALLWLTSPGSDFSLYAEVMDAPYLDPFKMLSSGNARKLRRQP